MSLPIAFWDSSALIPLCVQQEQTEIATALFAAYDVGVWWSTPVEIISGFTRLMRMGKMGTNDLLSGKQQAEIIATTWIRINSSARIEARACSLLELHPLRAADALQLAAALEWCESRPNGKVFLTFDKRLSEAARLAGFALE